MTPESPKIHIPADDIIRVNPATLIGLHQAAKNLPLQSSKIQARFSGNYLSTFKGRGMEFDEVRDDIRSLDWKVTARTGKPHTKLFREERERPVLLWVDYRKPMFFATRGSFKSVVAAKTAALLAWSAIQHGDRLGGLIFSEEVHQEIRPHRGKAASLHFIQQLADHPAWENFQGSSVPADTNRMTLSRLRRVARPGSLIFVISDFRNTHESFQANLAQLARHNDVLLLFISDPLEAELPRAGYYRVSDGHREFGFNTRDKKIQASYQQRFHNHRDGLRTLCRKLGIFFLPISTDTDLVNTLKNGLGLKRKK